MMSSAYYAVALFRFLAGTHALFSAKIGFLDALILFYAGSQPFNPLRDAAFTIPIE